MATTASAAGKAILLGEHAVVYGRPAIAVPLSDVRATVSVTARPEGGGIVFHAADLGQRFGLRGAGAGEPGDAAPALRATVENTLAALDMRAERADLEITIRSEIPIARGLGSGTAVSTALIRALAQHYGRSLAVAEVSQLAYRTEVLLHGTPSGVDNTVVAYEQPVYFRRGQPPAFPRIAAPLRLVIADTGIPARTRDTVAAVRRSWAADGAAYEALFDEIGEAVEAARRAIEGGELPLLGRLMSTNHDLLGRLGVSCDALDRLVGAAVAAGAWGAKLSGGGGGGCMAALVGDQAAAEAVGAALSAAGAQRVLHTTVRAVA